MHDTVVLHVSLTTAKTHSSNNIVWSRTRVRMSNSLFQVRHFSGFAFPVPNFLVLHFPPLHFWSCIFQSCIFRSCIFSPAFFSTAFWFLKLDIIGPAFSVPVFSGPVFSAPPCLVHLHLRGLLY